MKSAVVVFPASNCDRDAAVARASLKDMCEKFLANTMIEKYEIEP